MLTRKYNNDRLCYIEHWISYPFLAIFFLTKNWKVKGDSGSSLVFMLDCNLCDIKMKRRLRETYTTNRPCKLLDNEQKVLFYQNLVSSLNLFLPVG